MGTSPRIFYVKTSGDTLNVRSEPNGSILSTLDNGSVMKYTPSKSVNAGGRDWTQIQTESVTGWVATEFIAEAETTVLYEQYRVNDPSVPESNSVRATAFRAKLTDKTLKFIEQSAPMGVRRDELSSLSDTDLIEQAIDIFNGHWERFKGKATS